MSIDDQKAETIKVEFSVAQLRLLQSLVESFRYKGTPFYDAMGHASMKSRTGGVSNKTLRKQLAAKLQAASSYEAKASRPVNAPRRTARQRKAES